MANFEAMSFFRIADKAEGREAVSIEQTERRSAKFRGYIVPFRMLSVSNFKFPFSSVTRIREALRLQTISYSSADTIQIFPTPTTKSSKGSAGFTCFLPDAELSTVEAVPNVVAAQTVLIPAPFCLVSAVEGNGVTIWADEENICSALWEAGQPLLYRWRARKSDADIERESDWLRKYCAAKEREECKIFVLDVKEGTENILEIIKKSFADFAWLKEINLSRSAINSALVLEKFVRGISKAAFWLALVGVIFAFGNWVNYETSLKTVNDVRARIENLYREAFDKTGNIVDPVSQARARINAVRGTGNRGKSLGNVLADLGVPWKVGSMDVSVDSMRYNPDGADLTASAVDMTTIQSFRTSLVELVGTVQLGDVQQIPGGGFRFNLSLRW